MYKRLFKKFSILLFLFLLIPTTVFADEKINLSSFKNFSIGSDKIYENISIGWIQEVDENGNLKLCYYDSDNSKHIGWLKYDGKSYYFDLDGNLSTNYYSKISAN